jgi:DNA-directed RNA polymerase subunit RPC12/RpoP
MSQSSLESKKKWLAANQHKRPKINRDWKLRAVYGISPEEQEEMFVKQDYKCAICKEEFDFSVRNNPKYPHLDHEHSSGWVRGILCHNCNHGIGQFHEDINKMSAAIEYLISNAPPTEFNFNAAVAQCRLSLRRSRWNDPERVDEYRKATSEQMTGNTFRAGKEPWNKGKSWGEATKAKMSVSQKKRFSKG